MFSHIKNTWGKQRTNSARSVYFPTFPNFDVGSSVHRHTIQIN